MPEIIGFIGLGQMGGRMVRRFLAAGYTVHAYDTSRAALDAAVGHGAAAAGSVAEVARASEVVILSLPTPAVVREVVLGPGGIRETGGARCVIDHSTTGLEVEREVGAALAAAGVEVIDAPVSGGVRGAENGTLSIMVATPHDVLERRRPILERVGTKIVPVGTEPGQAQVMKLVNNMISSAAMIATAEGMVLGVKAGLDPTTMLEVLNSSTGKNSHTEDKFPRFVLPRTFNFGFTIGLLDKDVRLGLQMAKTLNVPMPVISGAEQLWSVALAEGGPDQDMTSIVKYFEKWAHVEVTGGPGTKK
ncbi:MAG: NAD(P)-dependent oxidoreductase [Chloroflexota bacterium]|nr:NAD(P)-dependent oxidoreductase [Chloroflexota bacterium]